MTTYQMGRGESRTYTITVTSAAGALVDLTDAEIFFVVRDISGDVVFQKRSLLAGGSADEIEIPDQAADSAALLGQCYLNLTATDTDLEQAARWADCWIQTSASPPEQIKVDEHSPFFITGAASPVFV